MFEWVPFPEPLVAAVAGLAVLHLLTVYAVHRMRSAAGQVDPAMAAGDDAVRCPECETVNERGYRFCRACVADLPAADGRAAAELGSSSRNPL